MSRRLLVAILAGLSVLALLVPTGSASAASVPAFPGLDCTEAPTPDMPGEGLAAFFASTPDPLPAQEDPFAPGARTTIYEQYGYSGLRWHTYDLGCGPDAARNPDAVIGTALSNWLTNIPISMSALTASVTQVAFEPTFLDIFDPAIAQISGALHRSLFATWVPAFIALIGIGILVKARRSALATTATAVGWALMVVLIATAIFRWPVASGHFADHTVTSTLGSVVNGVDGRNTDVKPAVAVASNVQESIFYKSWLAGTLGSTDSETAKKYGARLFQDQALTWHEAYVVQHDQEQGKQIIETKKDDWKTAASEIKNSDPAAYEHLTGKRSDTRVGYAILSMIAAVLALPFLLVASLLLLGSFLVVRLAVMMFPAFATLGVFPAGRGVVIGIGRTVGAALVNSIIFGVGAAVTIRVLGVILDPHSRLPGWLCLVLLPLFGFVMWAALKPFRRLTSMVYPHSDPFGDAAGAFGGAARGTGRFLKKAAATGVGVYTGNVAAAAAIGGDQEEPEAEKDVPDRAEARPQPVEPSWAAVGTSAEPGPRAIASTPDRGRAAPPATDPPPWTSPAGPERTDMRPEDDGFYRSAESTPTPPVEPEWVDGEEVYTVYRPSDDDAHDAA